MCLAVLSPVSFVGAGPGQQHNIYGTDAQAGADVGGASSVPGGSELTAWIDGVSYGMNTTVGAQFDLYVDGDTWGIDPDNWVKDGGYDGDSIQYMLDYDPATTYHFQISDYTSTFESGGYENDDQLFFDTQTDTDPNYTGPGGTYLRGLKINEVVLSPFPYVYLYDPGGEITEAYLEDATHGYYLEKDDPYPTTPPDINGPIFEFSANLPDVIAGPSSGYYYINLSGWTLDVDDELKLVWKNPVNWGGAATAHNIANGTDVVVDRVEWGNHQNYIDVVPDPPVRDHDNTSLQNAQGLPIVGESFRRNPNGTDSDNCTADFSILTATAPGPFGVGGMPGEPTGLMIHKGGGPYGGTASDLVLNWTAPTVDYGFLVKNIIYYDTDITNGFQYTSFFERDPISSGAGTPDGTVLVGFFADANDYNLIVRTTGDPTQGGPNENPTGTNIGYKYGEDLLKNPATTSQKFVSIPYFSDWTMASDIAGPGMEFTDGSIVSSILRWDYASQKFQSRTWVGPPFNTWNGDFAITPGDTLAVGITTVSPYTWKIVGSYDDTVTFNFIKNPTTTSQMFTSLPYHTSYTMASDLAGPGKEFVDGATITSVLQWNYPAQKFDSRTWVGPPFNTWNNDFTIDPMPGGHLAFGISTVSPYPWTPQVMGL
jgi:hypothetical protein